MSGFFSEAVNVVTFLETASQQGEFVMFRSLTCSNGQEKEVSYFKAQSQENLFVKRQDLSCLRLVATAFEYPPFTMKTKEGQGYRGIEVGGILCTQVGEIPCSLITWWEDPVAIVYLCGGETL